MLYTLYNAVPNCPELWEAGAIKLNSKGEPILRLVYGDYRVQRCANILALAG